LENKSSGNNNRSFASCPFFLSADCFLRPARVVFIRFVSASISFNALWRDVPWLASRYSALVSVAACPCVSGRYPYSASLCECLHITLNQFCALCAFLWLLPASTGCCCLVLRLLLPGTVFYLRN